MPPTSEQLKRAAEHSEIIFHTVAYLRSCGIAYSLSLPETLGIIELVKDQIMGDVAQKMEMEAKKKKKPPIVPPPPSDVNIPNPNDN